MVGEKKKGRKSWMFTPRRNRQAKHSKLEENRFARGLQSCCDIVVILFILVFLLVVPMNDVNH